MKLTEQRRYTKPGIEIINLSVEDIMTTSGVWDNDPNKGEWDPDEEE